MSPEAVSWQVKCNMRDMFKTPKKGALNFTLTVYE
jgi:hypothetical protein